MKRKEWIACLIGLILFALGIVLSVNYNHPHFYTIFSIGFFLILIVSYNSIAKKPLFGRWNIQQHLIFWGILIIASIIIDDIGIYLGYWNYPSFTSLFDEILKYLFEWAVPLVNFMLVLLIFKEILNRFLNKTASFVLSLLIFVPLSLLFTEYINQFSFSWKTLAMPISNYQINGFFAIWITLGSWLMALIPLLIYKLVDAGFIKTSRRFL